MPMIKTQTGLCGGYSAGKLGREVKSVE